MSHRWAIVWLDHFNATVIEFTADHSHSVTVRSALEHPQVHMKSGPQGSGHLPEDLAFFAAVVEAIGGAAEIVVVGPGVAKTAFKKHLDERYPSVADRVLGVETMDHPSEAQLLTYARRYVRRVDNLRG